MVLTLAMKSATDVVAEAAMRLARDSDAIIAVSGPFVMWGWR